MAAFDKERYDKYLYCRVRVKTTQGRIFEGEVVSFEGDLSSGYGMPTLDIEQAGYLALVTEEDIEDIEIISE